MARTVSIKVRFADFSTITRSKTLKVPTDLSRDVYGTARGLYDALGLVRARIRLVGVRLEGLREAETVPIQMELGAPEHGWRDAEKAVDSVTARFGKSAVRPARLISRTGSEETFRAKPPPAGSALRKSREVHD
jgi:DNA polymerase IV